MARNSLIDLNNHLFAQLERLGNEDLTEEELDLEVQRARSINGVAKQVIENAKITLEGARFAYTEIPQDRAIPDQFKLKGDETRKLLQRKG